MELNTLEIKEQTEVFGFTSIRDLVNKTLRNNYGAVKTGNATSTGFKKLDNVIGGFHNGDLITIAVKPGMGKTAFLLSVANNLAIKNNFSIAVFTSERSSQKITSRIIETETGMSVDQLLTSNMRASDRDHLHSMLGNIAKSKIYIDDTPALSISELKKKAALLKATNSADLIIVDYLELLTTSIDDSDNRAEQLRKISEELKSIARNLNIPILLFSQIGQTGGFLQKPLASDLPNYLSEHSDTLMILHRSDLQKSDKNGKGRDLVELLVLKNASEYSSVSVPIYYINSISKFVDAD